MVASLTVEQVRRFLTVANEMAPEHPGACAALAVLLMGLMDREICRARVDQLEQDGGFLRIAKPGPESSGLSVRIPQPLAEYLAEHGRGKAPTAPLFPHEDGGFAHHRWVGEWVRHLCHRAGIKVVSPTALRLIYATSTTGARPRMPAPPPAPAMPGAEA